MPAQGVLVVGLNNGVVEMFDLSTSDPIGSHEVHSKGVKTMTTWNDEKVLVRHSREKLSIEPIEPCLRAEMLCTSMKVLTMA